MRPGGQLLRATDALSDPDIFKALKNRGSKALTIGVCVESTLQREAPGVL